MTRGRLIRIGIAVAVLGGLGYVSYGVYEAGENLPAAPNQARNIAFQKGAASGRRLTGPSWSFDYDSVSTSADGQVSQIVGVHNGLLFRNGKIYAHMAAHHVSANMASSDFTATGKIHIIVVGGPHTRTLDTEVAVWTDSNKTLSLSKPVNIDDGGAKIVVQSLTIDFKSGDSKTGPVKGEFRLGG